MAFKVYRNTSDRRFGAATLPTRQLLVWAGPLFILVQGV
jgi:hypothetical protein